MDRFLVSTRQSEPSIFSSQSPLATVTINDSLDASELSVPSTNGGDFEINWEQLYFAGKRLVGAVYRQRHKRVIGTGAKISWVWQHGAELEHQGSRYWLCRRCHQSKKYHNQLLSAKGTSHIHEHMAAHHLLRESGPVLSSTSRNPFERANATTASFAIPDINTRLIDDVQWKEDYISWIICEDITFRQATGTRLRALFQSGGAKVDNIIPRSPTTVSSWIVESFEQRRLEVKDLVAQSRSKINLSFDLWTSGNELTLCGVVAHFIDRGGYLKTALLGMPRLLGTHSGENIASCLIIVIHEYELASKLGYFMMDNAKENDVAIRALAQTFPINEKKQRLRCAGHIINLITKALLFGKGVGKFQKELLGASDDATFDLWRRNGPIGKLHNTVTYINRSDSRRQEFGRCQVSSAPTEEESIFEYQLIKDGGIRWNSTYFMIKRGLKLRDAIDLYHLRWQKPTTKDAYDLSQDRLQQEDWAELERFLNLLSPFKKMTKRLEGNANKEGSEGSYGAVWEVLESMDYMNLKLEAAARAVVEEPESYYKTGIDYAYSKLQKYYIKTDDSPVYGAAIYLHPAHKEVYFDDKWQKWPAWIKKMRSSVEKFYEVYADDVRRAAKEQEIEQQQQSEHIDDDFESFRRVSSTFKTTKKRKVMDELKRWIDDGIPEEDLDIHQPLVWWRKHASTYPILSKMAFDLFSIPGMSAECERVFSQAKKLITDERNRLGAHTIEADECLKNWILHKLVGDGR